MRSLSQIFSQGFLLRDTNGDGLTDYLEARIIVSEDAPVEDLVGASNIAARLGFETMSLDLPLLLRDSEVSDLREVPNPILVGRKNRLAAALMEEGLILEGCRPGEGVIQLYASPSDGFSAVVVTGGDDEGTRMAANYMAARMPHLWAPDGPSLGDVEREVIDFLSKRGISVDSCHAVGILLEGSKTEVSSLSLSLTLKNDEDLLSAEEDLLHLASAHSQGKMRDMLSYPSVSRLHLRLISQNLRREVEVPRAEEGRLERVCLRERRVTPRRLSLSKLYTTEGLLGAPSGGLIPDRLNTVIIVGRGAAGAIDIAARLGLESTGVCLPVAKTDSEVEEPVNPVL
ncbi:hypothetical protein DRO56_03530, partial [Candidatus Bathyarchaeota archaeon]